MPRLTRPFMRLLRGAVRTIRWFGGFAAAVFARVFAHNVTGRASQFAYNAFLATVPFLFVLVAVVGLVASPDFSESLVSDLESEIPSGFAALIKDAVDAATGNTRNAAIALGIGLIVGLYVVSNVMVTLMGALDNAYGVRHRPWLAGRIIAMGLAAIESLLAILATAALVGGPRLVRGVADLAGVQSDAIVRLAERGVLVLGLTALITLVFVLYRIGPNTRNNRLLEILPGAVVAVAAWLGTTRLFRLFLDNFDQYSNVYGALASVVVYLWYLYMSGIVLLVGAEMNGELAKRRSVRDALRRQTRKPPSAPSEPETAVLPDTAAAPQAGADASTQDTLVDEDSATDRVVPLRRRQAPPGA